MLKINTQYICGVDHHKHDNVYWIDKKFNSRYEAIKYILTHFWCNRFYISKSNDLSTTETIYIKDIDCKKYVI